MFINLRNGMMGGKRTPTAKDYVQSGLVAMWDGIENAGWGVHDPNATVWKNIAASGTGDFNVVGNGAFGSDFFAFNGVSAEADFSFRPHAIEIIVRLDSGAVVLYDCRNGSASSGGNGGVDNIIARQGNGNWCVGLVNATNVNSAYPSGASSALGVVQYLANILNPTGLTVPGPAYCNGVPNTAYLTNTWYKQSTITLGGRKVGTNPYNGQGRVYCLRYYSRALTAEEIAANYAIDKERFNLPDAT